MKKLWLSLAVLVVLGGLFALLQPSQAILGTIRGETFFQGRPASAWAKQLRSADPVSVEEARAAFTSGGAEGVEVLVTLLKHQPGSDWESAEIRWQVCELLASIGPAAKPAAADLIAACSDGDPHVRNVAAAALPKVDAASEAAVPVLVKMLENDKTVNVLRALSEYGSDAAPALEPLVEILKDQDLATEVRWNAARTLGKLRAAGVSAEAVLVEHLKDKEATVREHSAEALGDIGPGAKNSVSALVAVLADPATRVRRDAVRSLGQIGTVSEEALPEIRKLLKDPEKIVQDAAKTALEILDPQKPADDDDGAERTEPGNGSE